MLQVLQQGNAESTCPMEEHENVLLNSLKMTAEDRGSRTLGHGERKGESTGGPWLAVRTPERQGGERCCPAGKADHGFSV